MLAAIHLVPTWAMILLLGVGALLATRIIGMLFRAKVTAGALVVVLLVGAALVFALLLPAARGPAPKVTSRASPTPPIGLPLASLDTGRPDIEQFIDAAKIHGRQAVEIAQEKIQIGAEALTDAAQRVAGETRVLIREHHIQIPPMPDAALRVVNGVRHATPTGLVASGLMAFAIGALLYLGYIFLDASTRGHFTWSLRFASILTFAALCAALSVLRHGL